VHIYAETEEADQGIPEVTALSAADSRQQVSSSAEENTSESKEKQSKRRRKKAKEPVSLKGKPLT
jgi:hypothetical protein